MTHLVFTYGSLLTGLGNHRVISAGELIGEAITEAGWTLVSLGGFPGAIEGGGVAIVGELYRVSDAMLERLDQLEGNGSFYTRVERKIITTDGRERIAWIYALPSENLNRPIVESGDWREFHALRAPAHSWFSVSTRYDDDDNDSDDGEPYPWENDDEDVITCEGCECRDATTKALGLDLCRECARLFVSDDDEVASC